MIENRGYTQLKQLAMIGHVFMTHCFITDKRSALYPGVIRTSSFKVEADRSCIFCDLRLKNVLLKDKFTLYTAVGRKVSALFENGWFIGTIECYN